MRSPICRFLRTLGATALLGLPLVLRAQPAHASAEDAAWFAGEWGVAPVPVEGFEDIATTPPTTVRIEHTGDSRLVRHSPERDGRPAASVAFTVKTFGGNFPWWPETGGSGAVARRVSETSFDLASVGPMGKADWSRALRHTRVVTPPAEEPPRLPHGFVQILVNHVKPDRQADFELWLHEYRLMVERLIVEGKLSAAEQSAYAAWRILVPDNATLALNQEAGLPLEYLFIFDPMEPGASYDLADYLSRGLGAEAAARKLAEWRELLAKPQTVLSGVPL
ncbi:MAG TPA: hypothetical protein PLF88_13345 [Opitutaceae bacterium]|nr:hypothetical protein [Opitutaceae bacterium]HRJ46405.1 hypothetical protein [Opitutaceae bacterium]